MIVCGTIAKFLNSFSDDFLVSGGFLFLFETRAPRPTQLVADSLLFSLRPSLSLFKARVASSSALVCKFAVVDARDLLVLIKQVKLSYQSHQKGLSIPYNRIL